MLIEFTDKDADKRDALKEKYGVPSPTSWKDADSFEDAVALFDKYERDGEEIADFRKYWNDDETDEDELDDEEDEYDDFNVAYMED